MHAKKYALMISFCLLTSCVSQKPTHELSAPETLIPVAKDKAEKTSISSFEINGALAAKSKAKGWSAAMNWLQTGPNAYQIRLIGPLGSGSVLIKGSGESITFQSGSKTATSNNANELLLKHTGIQLPVRNLYYWVRGLSAPGSVASESRDQDHHLLTLNQSGYTIHFSNYVSVQGVDVPGLIRLEGKGVMIKVIIKNWKIIR